eukprot:scaffold7740_cov112-Isochrysis_galbana.AAC.12
MDMGAWWWWWWQGAWWRGGGQDEWWGGADSKNEWEWHGGGRQGKGRGSLESSGGGDEAWTHGAEVAVVVVVGMGVVAKSMGGQGGGMVARMRSGSGMAVTGVARKSMGRGDFEPGGGGGGGGQDWGHSRASKGGGGFGGEGWQGSNGSSMWGQGLQHCEGRHVDERHHGLQCSPPGRDDFARARARARLVQEEKESAERRGQKRRQELAVMESEDQVLEDWKREQQLRSRRYG